MRFISSHPRRRPSVREGGNRVWSAQDEPAREAPRFWRLLLLSSLLSSLLASTASGQLPDISAADSFNAIDPANAGRIDLPVIDPNQEITLSATHVQRWTEGAFEVLLLEGNCVIEQGPQLIRAQSAVVWLERSSVFSLTPHQMTVYVEGVQVEFADEAPQSEGSRLQAERWETRLRTYQPIRFAVALPELQQPQPLPAVYERARELVYPSSIGAIRTIQFDSPFFQGTLTGPSADQNPPPAFVPGAALPMAEPKRIRVFPRSSNSRINSSSFITPDGRERVTVVDSGVNIILTGMARLGTVDISTDRVVIWSPAEGGGLSLDDTQSGGSGTAVEIYMEGNIVFRQADRIIYAKSMYYNVQQESGIVLDAELLTGIPQYDGVLRLRADVLRQVNSSRFQASNAALTSSRLGVPSYWFQSGDLQFEDNTEPVIDPVTGAPVIDPATGQPALLGQRLATSRNNAIYVGEIPVFFWPVLSTNLIRPTTYVNRIRLSNDRIFGTQIGLGFDVNQLTGLGARLPGTDWSATIDYLSNRGVGFGTTYEYVFDRFLGINGETRGFFDAWGLRDTGLDDLGADRRGLVPEKRNRGRALWQHRQRLANGLQITRELGWISDRNFLEQYYEREWDQWKDQTTGGEFKYLIGTGSWNLSTNFRLNDFFTQTEWLRLDQFQLGQSLIQDRITWFGRNQIGYGNLKTATRPTDPKDAATFNPLAWEVPSKGIRTGARHELDLPLNVGGWKVVPYALGEVMHWGEDIDGLSNTRLFGQLGIRASVPFWSVNPTIRDELFNLNGLAHKVVLESEFFWADANRNLDQFPLYDPLDDDAIEHFRRRLPDSTFGGALNVDNFAPRRFAAQSYALRSGLQSWVTSPVPEIADDLTLLRVNVRQRWQTKRGLAGSERIIDWMTLDMGGTLFPRADRDNFGENFGMFNYDWRWHVGDRVTLLSDGYLDAFSDGMRMANIGGYISRPERGSAYLGFRSIGGPFNSNVLNAAISYRMSQKWIGSASTAIDLGPTGNIGELFELTRIGESFLVSIGANIDRSRDNVGFRMSIEPRFLPSSFRGRVGGVAIPPAGAYGLE